MSESNQNTSENQNSVPKSKVEQLDVLEQLLKPEIQESLTTLVESLPKLTEMVTLLGRSYDFFQSFATDEVFINDVKEGFKLFYKPVEHTAKDLAATAIEARDAVANNPNQGTIGLFGLLRLLKEPQMQKLFHFAQAFLKISAEKEGK